MSIVIRAALFFGFLVFLCGEALASPQERVVGEWVVTHVEIMDSIRALEKQKQVFFLSLKKGGKLRFNFSPSSQSKDKPFFVTGTWGVKHTDKWQREGAKLTLVYEEDKKSKTTVYRVFFPKEKDKILMAESGQNSFHLKRVIAKPKK